MNKPKWNDEYGQRFTDVMYGSREHNKYDLYLPNDAALQDSLALILYVHGGSWLGGDKNMHDSDCYAWLKRGYATATMNYSLLNEDGVSIPTMLDEIDSCIQHIEGFAAGKGVRIRQMAIGGTSAGGHLAMMYAYGRSHRLPLRFATIKVGPSDLRILFPYDGNAKNEEVEKFAFSCTGQHWDAPALTPELLDSIKLQASPIAYLNDSTALPSIFAYGGTDGLVKSDNYRALQAQYDSLGRPYDLIVFPNSGHFLNNDKDCSERYDSAMIAYCKKYFGY
ncbi:MAG: alpha/beta hydrolase [Bacteroidaceae bacterium]|nr:alpha/beta hydrolase [Bacteroidaceae bacterium]